MTKADIVSEISKATGIDKASVLETVEKFMETVKDSLSNGENVYLRKDPFAKDCTQHLSKHHNDYSRAQHSCLQAS